MEAFQVMLIIAFVLSIIELMTTSFFFLGMAFGALSVSLTQWFAAGPSINRDLLIFALISTLSFLLLRRLFAKPKDSEIAQEDVNRY
ncbi:MAG: hypothetical protein QM527_15455 [Alphaproteobacteria bacterium]|nr:hypothetical protein [Alphaproteobacteria bacterium]